MRAVLFSKIVAGALLATCGAVQAQGVTPQACGKPSCVLPDVTVSATAYDRALIAADPSTPGRLLAGFRDSQCPSRLRVSVLSDDGVQWQGACVPVPDDFFGYAAESPAVAVNRRGELLAPAVYDDGADTYFVGMHRSTDGGASWSKFTYVGGTTYFKGRARNLHLTVDASPESPHRGTVYATYTADGPQDEYIHIRLARSTDGGKTWTEHHASPEYDTHGIVLSVDNASLAVGRDGSLYMTYTKCEGSGAYACSAPDDEVMLTVSHDGGLTWDLQGPIAAVQKPLRPVVAVDASSGPDRDRLYLVTNQRAGRRSVVMASQSSDHGVTWTAPMRVATGKAGQYWPQVSVSGKGQLAVTWMDERDDAQGHWMQPMLTLSSDGGASFSKAVALDADLSDPKKTWGSELVSHTWSGGHLRAVFSGPNADGTRGVRAGGLSR